MAETNHKDNDATEFATVLLGHSKGRAHDAASKLLKEAVEAVKLTGRKASVTVKFEISPIKNNNRVVQLGDKVTATIPEEKRDSIWFTDDDGGLHRNDPDQLTMEYGGTPTKSSTAEGNS
ncbi:hypothetical protein H7J86_24220 [Mycobacterium hackensackense]|uniref:hypothetical protein n=1 Tax=Mycobacterium hackensackense TaxID=228909 RepID=UPI002265F35A|nr:hypothetical protein [Mycobacterium hackensackense]MCV7255273.1 hypothetical protein [Mycobacterium hackensackense]